MRRFSLVLLILVLAAVVVAVGCGGTNSNTTNTQPPPQQGTVFITGQDAPVASVLAFQITVSSIKLTDTSNQTVTLDAPGSVEFTRFLGLRTLLALNTIPAATYNSATVTFASPVISYLDISTNPASVKTIQGTLTNSSVTVALNPTMAVSANGLAGLHMHFDLRQSLVVDGSGQLTGQVSPVLQFRALQVNDSDAEVDDLRGSVASINTGAGSFVLQRWSGRQITIATDNNTDWEGAATGIGNLTNSSIVEIDGHVQADGSILASNVAVYTTDKQFLGGIVLNVTPSSGDANNINLLVRDEMPVTSGISVGQPTTVTVDSTTIFDIYHLNLPISQLLFNQSSLIVGQAVVVGGTVDTTNNPPTVAARRVVLHRQGMDGKMVAGSLVINSGNQGNFQLQNNGFWGYLLGAPIKVITTNNTQFINLSGLSAITSSMPLRVTGLILKDQGGNPVLVAGRVRQLL